MMFEDGGALGFGGVGGENGFDRNVLHRGAQSGFGKSTGAKIGEIIEPEAGLAFLTAGILGAAADLVGGVLLDNIEKLKDDGKSLAVLGGQVGEPRLLAIVVETRTQKRSQIRIALFFEHFREEAANFVEV